MTLLVTGFEPFGDVGVNSSQQVVESLALRRGLVRGILPVCYGAIEARIASLLADYNPRAWLMLGMAGGRAAIQLERVALNLDDAVAADNFGEVRQGRPIVADGPLAYGSCLPLDAFYTALERRAISVAYSNHAGTYLCNHAFYYGRHLGARCGFVHLPAIGDDAPKMPLAQMAAAVELCLDVLDAL